MSWVVGSDTGGTFTDLVALNEGGELRIAKVPSTPPAFERGVLHGIEKLGVQLADVRTIFYATTATTNAAITCTGAKTALITTSGFRDILELRRSDRADLYDILWDPPPPLIRRRDRLEVAERVNYAGEILEPLDEESAGDVVRMLRARSIEAVAVCLINAFANPAHEQRVREILAAELPDVHVSISTDILPEPPEFERTATTVANAYLAPVLARYMDELDAATRRGGYEGRFVLVMHNAGGTMSADYATRVPVRTLQSGPAGGAIAGAAVARSLGRDRVVCLDMGGTSADVSLILDGQPLLTQSSEAEWGLPIRFPSIDVVSVGAGGGSIAWVDGAGTPKSGPESAGAVPGPACYGRGGERPTTTDAHLVLGNLGTRAPLGGEVAPDHDLAARALDEHFASSLGLELEDAAEAVIRVANANLVRPLRLLTIERGFHPREFTLVVFGGAGGMHGVELARELGIPEVVVPAHPGVTSALGLLSAPPADDFSAAINQPLAAAAIAAAQTRYAEIEQRVRENLESQGVEPGEIDVGYSIDLRYAGQFHSLTVPLAAPDADGFAEARAAFDREHQRQYRYSHPEWDVELVVIRASAQGRREVGDASYSAGADQTALAPYTRGVRFAGGSSSVECDVVDRRSITPGDRIDGPVIVEQSDSTTVIPPGASATCTETGKLVIATQEARQ